ncbi:hypothetical protein Fmac_001480 [Flemingia macrophylla]|uniref:Uncharacterized protein n=1 Tax=Flemingia macrophylla TaxID=520843 RepID=A0ABD1NK10_9FABA
MQEDNAGRLNHVSRPYLHESCSMGFVSNAGWYFHAYIRLDIALIFLVQYQEIWIRKA